MSAIAAELGGSKGTLWRYFKSKEELLSAVIVRTSLALRNELAPALSSQRTIGSSLRCFIKGFLVRLTMPDSVALYRLVLSEAGRCPEIGKTFYENSMDEIYRLLSVYLSDQMDRGLILLGDPAQAARGLIGLCLIGCHHHLLLGIITHADQQHIENDVNYSVATFLSAHAIG